jgi:hypothetical protein
MTYQGHIEDGVVVFNQPLSRPEGTEVLVEVAAPARGRATAPEDFWRERSMAELIKEQGVAPARRFEEVLGQGTTLWDDDRQFDEFLRNIGDRREGMAS